MTREALIHALSGALRGRDDVRLALLFGSFARGEATEASDADVAVDAASASVLELTDTLSRAAGREVQVVRLTHAGIPLLEELIRDAIVVHEARPGAAALWRSHTLADLEIDRPWYARMRDSWLKRVAEEGLTHGKP